MHPELHINYLAVLVAVVTNFIIGWLWYGPILGKAWMKEMGIAADFKPDPKEMYKSMGFMVIGSFLTAYVLFYTTNVWKASSWHAGEDSPAYVYGFFSGIYTWIGFYIPLLINSVAFEGKSWKLFGINAGFYLISLQTIAMILSYWR
ncbi:PF08570 family protein [Leptospira santarosai]|uniref:PF08570 family protein n=1 Tax=Leptospira santarosai TaxID=28183 RepID=A0A2P1QX97_9LEPT|nr:PF08570 family protein [Leptospira santarosai]